MWNDAYEKNNSKKWNDIINKQMIQFNYLKVQVDVKLYNDKSD